MTTINASVAPQTTKDNVAKAKALFFTGAGVSFAISIFLFFSGDKQNGMYVGLWVPSILSAGALIVGGRHND